MWPTSSHVLRRLPDRPQNWGKLDSMKRLLALVILFAASACAQSRNIVLTWTASTSTGITGYAVLMAATPTGTFAQIGCVGSVAGSTCVSGTTASTTTYTDTEATGASYSYEVVAVAAACTPTTPVGTACGSSPPSTVSTTTVPPKPVSITTVVLTVP